MFSILLRWGENIATFLLFAEWAKYTGLECATDLYPISLFFLLNSVHFSEWYFDAEQGFVHVFCIK